jgi:hypothetical protein
MVVIGVPSDFLAVYAAIYDFKSGARTGGGARRKMRNSLPSLTPAPRRIVFCAEKSAVRPSVAVRSGRKWAEAPEPCLLIIGEWLCLALFQLAFLRLKRTG